MVIASSAYELPFADVEQDKWYYGSVKDVFGRGLIKGIDETHFDPEGTLSRARFVTIPGRFDEVDTEVYIGTSFKDEKAGQRYAPYIEWDAE